MIMWVLYRIHSTHFLFKCLNNHCLNGKVILWNCQHFAFIKTEHVLLWGPMSHLYGPHSYTVYTFYIF